MSPQPPSLSSSIFYVQGLVQGVGFRPFVYRIAHKYGLNGWVRNSDEGVEIRLEGPSDAIGLFLKELQSHPPAAARIDTVKEERCKAGGETGFTIRKSHSSSRRITRVSPDIAVCDDCLDDMKTQPHRLAYPFINCTHCGPRFTIIRALPYDRKHTTMAPFVMCDTCRPEYEAVTDRRFHAQPVACNTCGPFYTLARHSKKETEAISGGQEPAPVKEIHEILTVTAGIIRRGGIIAIKGMGGFHLMCDAQNEEAVQRLRDTKQRDGKPFAVMVRDTASAGRYVKISPEEELSLNAWRRPIVLLKIRKEAGAPSLAPEIHPGCSTIGMMLPYMPFHHLLFEYVETPALVMTSGNLSDEPIIIDNDKAMAAFREMAEATITYNRDIHNRADDSVVFVAGGRERVIRRSRGYVPEPVRLPFDAEGIFATGAELNHCFAIGKGKEVMLSQHIGDLKDPETYAFFRESAGRFCRLFRLQPATMACDNHPDYLSTRYAKEQKLPIVEVQHHHAHVAACMAEFHLNEPVMGVCWDGTGLGTDGHIWGGEFLYADYASFERFAHFDYLPLPGGDKAAIETWRTGLSLLHRAYGEAFTSLDLPFMHKMRENPQWALLVQAVSRPIHSPLSSAAGRLFDAVAAITGICGHNSYHAEAPMKWESILDERIRGEYPYIYVERGQAHPDAPVAGGEKAQRAGPGVIDFRPMVRAVVDDFQKGIPNAVISAKFHNTMISVIEAVVDAMSGWYGTRKVVLTGGVFQNRYLLEKAEERLSERFEVYTPCRIPANDAGIALGQLAVAAHRRNAGGAGQYKERH